MKPDILIADDDPFVVRSLKTRLSAEGYEVISAPGGEAAVKMFQSFHPRLVILDAAMPDMSGMDVCRHVRESDPERRSKVVFLTGASTPSADFVERCAEASDADGYLRKPYDAGELIALVESVLAPDKDLRATE